MNNVSCLWTSESRGLYKVAQTILYRTLQWTFGDGFLGFYKV